MWQEDFEERLYERLEKETDPENTKILMETIATGRAVQISDDGKSHGNIIDQATFNRLAATDNPVVENYRKCLKRWGADPNIHPMEPYAEWAMRFGCDPDLGKAQTHG